MQTLITLAIEPQLAQKREKKTTSADHVKEMKWFDRHSFLFIFFFVIAKVKSASSTIFSWFISWSHLYDNENRCDHKEMNH